MIKFIKNFRKDEDGAVTVDWVVLTAAVVGLGIAAVSTVSNGIDAAATSLNSDLTTDMTAATAANS
ncbi:pilus assembly protein [Thalassovita sp.]|uniref:Flp family type IVb pilin n=1 Tax=Thalassovita sp. TaxID=1979401 RepID=UPI002B274F3F|nr:pilus assembly protein [Thalassovita sp.]